VSVLIEFAMFPTDKGISVSKDVSKVISMIKNDFTSYTLTAMGTIIETNTLAEALSVVQKAHDILEKDSERIYATIKLDIQKNKENRMSGKIASVEEKMGKVQQ
jgi:uncharacterized protein (TIGR00106 family)